MNEIFSLSSFFLSLFKHHNNDDDDENIKAKLDSQDPPKPKNKHTHTHLENEKLVYSIFFNGNFVVVCIKLMIFFLFSVSSEIFWKRNFIKKFFCFLKIISYVVKRELVEQQQQKTIFFSSQNHLS